MFESLKTFDGKLSQYIYLHRPAGADSFLLWATNNATAITFAFILVLIFLYFVKKRQKYLYAAVNILIIIGLSAVVSNLLKMITKRLRPYDVFDNMVLHSSIGAGGYSFPSGHTTEVFALSVAVFLLLRNPYLRWLSLFWALLIAYTRMAFGVHYPSDILGGILIGSLTAWFWLRWTPLKDFFKKLTV